MGNPYLGIEFRTEDTGILMRAAQNDTVYADMISKPENIYAGQENLIPEE